MYPYLRHSDAGVFTVRTLASASLSLMPGFPISTRLAALLAHYEHLDTVLGLCC